jgi:hypothetical protein
VTIGLWPADRDLLEEFVAVMGEEVAGLYQPEAGALFVVSDTPAPFSQWLAAAQARGDLMAEFALSHEIVHLLQHRRYPELLEGDAFYFANDDVGIAVQSAFEGDAMYFGVLAMGGPLPDPALFASSFEEELGDGDGALASAPRLIRELIGFPYAQGYRLASLEGVQLLESPPASTEQVLHDDLRHAEFTAYDLGAVAAALPAPCEVVFENTVGELQMGVLLRDATQGDVSSAVWEGWDGDRYLAVDCNGRAAFLWLTSWDSEADAEEFAAGEVQRRGGLSGPPWIHRSGRDVVVTSDPLHDLAETLAGRVVRQRLKTVDELRAFVEGR